MAYDVQFHPDVEKQLRGFPKKIQRQLLAKIALLADDPRPHNAEKLVEDSVLLYRIRSGDYRIIYHVRDDHPPLVLVIKTADRKEAYRRMDELVRYIRRRGR